MKWNYLFYNRTWRANTRKQQDKNAPKLLKTTEGERMSLVFQDDDFASVSFILNLSSSCVSSYSIRKNAEIFVCYCTNRFCKFSKRIIRPSNTLNSLWNSLFVHTAVILIMAVLLCLDMCNIIGITKGNSSTYEWSINSKDEYLNSIYARMLLYLGYIDLLSFYKIVLTFSFLSF